MTATVLIVGGGGREHALAMAMARSPLVGRVYMTAINAGCERFAMPERVDDGDYESLADFCNRQGITLVIIGPEAPLANGAADTLRAAKVAVFGPSQFAARIEYSKIYAKTLMKNNNIPTPPFAIVKDAAGLTQWCANHQPPYVIKADSLAAGKGVFICEDEPQAQQAAADIMGGKFGGKGVIAEQFCGGAETSFIVITDGKDAIPLPSSSDYKRAMDGGKGANTGGMGAISPSPWFNDDAQERVMQTIIRPTLKAMAKDGAPFCGFLYAGLVRDDDGKWQVLEFNCRMGDPEAQAILPRLQGDIFPLLMAAAKGEGFAGLTMPQATGASVCIVLAAAGYPQKPTIGDTITIESPPPNVCLYYAATKRKGDTITTNGGRIMSIVATADNAADATKLAYKGAAGVKFKGMHYRRDIGKTIGE